MQVCRTYVYMIFFPLYINIQDISPIIFFIIQLTFILSHTWKQKKTNEKFHKKLLKLSQLEYHLLFMTDSTLWL